MHGFRVTVTIFAWSLMVPLGAAEDHTTAVKLTTPETADTVGGMSEGWRVYVVECADGTWYTGIAKDVDKRIEQHNAGRGARYTRGRGPVSLLAQSDLLSRTDALRLEYQVKQRRRTEKLAILAGAAIPR